MAFEAKWHSDPSHGWLQINYADLVEVGVHEDISACSYINRQTSKVYLEEDVDANTFLEACEEQGILVNIASTEVWHEEKCFIRDLEPYPFTVQEQTS